MISQLLRHWQKRPPPDSEFAHLFAKATPGAGLVALDTETTSLDCRTAEIVSIGAVRIQGQRILTSQGLHLMVKPGGRMVPESIKTHQLRHCDLENAMEPVAALRQLLHFIGPSPLVGYYLEFDLAIINRYVTSLFGWRLPNRGMELSALYYNKKIGYLPTRTIDLRFEVIRENLGIPDLGRHDAMNDAIMIALMYIKLKHAAHS